MPSITQGVTNFWTRKRRETELLRIVSWAQYYGIRVEDLTADQIQAALDTLRYTNPPDDLS